MSNNFLDDNSKSVFLRCVDHAEMVMFTKFDWGFESKEDKEKMKKFLTDCLELIDEED